MDPIMTMLRRQANAHFVSIGDLIQDQPYPITKFGSQDTKFGTAVIGTLQNGDEGDLNVFFPKAVQMTEEQIMSYNEREVKNLKFVFKGKRARAFIYDFIEW